MNAAKLSVFFAVSALKNAVQYRQIFRLATVSPPALAGRDRRRVVPTKRR